MKPKDLAIFVYGSKTDNQTGNKLPLCLAGLELPIGTQRLIHILEPNQAMIINTHTQWVQQIKSLLTQTTPVMLHIQHDNSQILKSTAYHMADYAWGTNPAAKFTANHVELRLKEFNYVPPFDPFEL
jgi:hypothetical protein